MGSPAQFTHRARRFWSSTTSRSRSGLRNRFSNCGHPHEWNLEMCLIDPSCVHSASTNTLSYQPPADNRTPPPGSLPSGLAPWPSALRAVLPTSPDALVLRLRTRRVSTDTPDRRFSVAPHADAMVGSTATAFNGGGGRSKAVPSAVNTRHTHSMPLLVAGAGVDAGADSTSLPSPDVPSLGLEPAPAPPPAPAPRFPRRDARATGV